MQNSLADLIRNHMNNTSVEGSHVVEKEEPLSLMQVVREFSTALSEPVDKESIENSEYIVSEVDDLLMKFEEHCSKITLYLVKRREVAVFKIIKAIAANPDFKIRICVEEDKQLFYPKDTSLEAELDKFFPAGKVKIIRMRDYIVIGLHDGIAHPFSYNGVDEELIALL